MASAEAICNNGGDLGLEVLDGLEALVNKSLLKQHEDDTDEIRFRMLPTIREYGLEKLSEQAELEGVEQTYIDYFTQLAEKLDNKLSSADHLGALKQFESEYENLREGLYRATVRPFTALAWHLAGALGGYWLARGYYREGREYLERVLALTGEQITKATRVKVLNKAGSLTLEQGDYQLVRVYAEESLPLGRETGNKKGICNALSLLGSVEWLQGNYFKAQGYFEESLTLSKEFENNSEIFTSLLCLGLTFMELGDYPKAQGYFEENLLLGLRTKNEHATAGSLIYFGLIALKQEAYSKALTYLEEGLSLCRSFNLRFMTFMSLISLGTTATNLGNYPKARSYLEECLKLAVQLGDKRSMSFSLAGFIFLISEQRRSSKAGSNEEYSEYLKRMAYLGGATAVLLSKSGLVLTPPWRSYYEQGVEAARAGLGEEAFALAFAEGQSMNMEEVTRFALVGELTEGTID